MFTLRMSYNSGASRHPFALDATSLKVNLPPPIPYSRHLQKVPVLDVRKKSIQGLCEEFGIFNLGIARQKSLQAMRKQRDILEIKKSSPVKRKFEAF